MSKTLGILGGLGPAASVYFYRLVTEHTAAMCDQEHCSIVLISGADIPDRSDFILGKSDRSPLPMMKEDVLKLAGAGADLIAIPCNTAHYFFDELSKISPVPVLNIVRETVQLAERTGVHRLGILATTGTVRAGAYQHACAGAGMEYRIPGEASQQRLMDIIYHSIKRAKAPHLAAFYDVAEELRSDGCDAIVLGCTELSLLPLGPESEPYHFIDSLLVLTYKAITECGKLPCGFSELYTYVAQVPVYAEKMKSAPTLL